MTLMKSWYLIKTKANQELIAQQNLQSQNYVTYCPNALINNKNVILLAGSVDSDAKKKCMNKFSNLKIEAFGNDQYTLVENLLNASDLFQQKLNYYLSFYQ